MLPWAHSMEGVISCNSLTHITALQRGNMTEERMKHSDDCLNLASSQVNFFIQSTLSCRGSCVANIRNDVISNTIIWSHWDFLYCTLRFPLLYRRNWWQSYASLLKAITLQPSLYHLITFPSFPFLLGSSEDSLGSMRSAKKCILNLSYHSENSNHIESFYYSFLQICLYHACDGQQHCLCVHSHSEKEFLCIFITLYSSLHCKPDNRCLSFLKCNLGEGGLLTSYLHGCIWICYELMPVQNNVK